MIAILALVAAESIAYKQAGFNLSIDLKASFVNSHYNKVTATADFLVVSVKNTVNPPSQDGEIHIGGICLSPGTSADLGFATVAEVWKAASQQPVVSALRAAQAEKSNVRMQGVWRLWAEHAGGSGTVAQGLYEHPDFWTHPSNPDHIFEIHPVTKVWKGNSVYDLRPSLTFLPGFDPIRPTSPRAATWFPRFENTQCRITPRNGRVVIETNIRAVNFMSFYAQPLEPPRNTGEGWTLQARIYDTSGESPVAENVRLVFARGIPAASGFRKDRIPPKTMYAGFARYGLSKAREALQSGQVYEGKMDYEMIVVCRVDP